MSEEFKKPKYELEIYRKFVREASPYISIILGRKVRPEEGDKMTDEEVFELALKIDARVDDLKGKRH